MKIEHLRISNFRGIRNVNLSQLSGVVVIAGQNGSGKSCIFDAIRLIKSVYGGYQQNEWAQWMGEFQIALTNSADDFSSMFNDAGKEIVIECGFALSARERAFIRSNAPELVRERVLRTLIPEAYGWTANVSNISSQVREREGEIDERMRVELGLVDAELDEPILVGKFTISPGDIPRIQNSAVLSIVFSTFRPTEIGVIDYHGAQRHYGRESVHGMNLNLGADLQTQRSQTALYNYAAKYNNVKSEMASSYVRELLADQAGLDRTTRPTLTGTLQELFATFFPHKRFMGPRPTLAGKLSFPVETDGGGVHDLDELSSGEKEILYGYLRIRNSAPCNSIILLDEPELHLNPRLIRNLPEFYRKNLGELLNNQIWLVSHSDALLREVVARPGYSVFHMIPSAFTASGENQIRSMAAPGDLEIALSDLVGDLAAYRPNGKIVVVEGGGDSEFDSRVIQMLFPELLDSANIISGENKAKVRALLALLEKASSEGVLPFQFCCITDRDADASDELSAAHFQWDVYHIENYLLDPSVITAVLRDIQMDASIEEGDVLAALAATARELLPDMVRRDLVAWSNRLLVGQIAIGFDPSASDSSTALLDAVDRSLERISSVREHELSVEIVTQRIEAVRERNLEGFKSGEWKSLMPGRDILKRFVRSSSVNVPYEVFRNLILAKMVSLGIKPSGMERVIRSVMAGT